MTFKTALQFFVDVEKKLNDGTNPITEREALEGLALGLQELTLALEKQLKDIEVKVPSSR